MMTRISNTDIARSSTLEKTDWNKYAVIVSGCFLICKSKKEAEIFAHNIRELEKN